VRFERIMRNKKRHSKDEEWRWSVNELKVIIYFLLTLFLLLILVLLVLVCQSSTVRYYFYAIHFIIIVPN